MSFRYNFFTARNWKIRIIQFVNAMSSCLVLLFAFSFTGLVSAVLFYFLFLCIGVNVAAHRYFSHNAFKTSKGLEAFLGVCMCLATVGSPLAWANMHHSHHKFSDQEKDPHSPIVSGKRSFSGYFAAFFGFWSKKIEIPYKTSKLRRKSTQKFFHFYYFAVIATYLFLCGVFGGWSGIVYGYCLPATMTFLGAGLIVTLGHSAKERSTDTVDFTEDSCLLHFLTWGEGLHKTHHLQPGKYHYKSKNPFMVDLPGLLIKHFLKR